MTDAEADVVGLLRAARTYRSTAVVGAVRLDASRTWHTDRGSELSADPGDWVLTDGATEWTVDDAVFRSTYRRRPDGRFEKHGVVRAVRVDRAVAVPTLEGTAAAEAGDWVLSGSSGDLWPVTDVYFRGHYVLVGEER